MKSIANRLVLVISLIELLQAQCVLETDLVGIDQGDFMSNLREIKMIDPSKWRLHAFETCVSEDETLLGM